MKRLFIIIGCLAFAAIALLFLIPTIVIAFEGGFRPREVLSERSSDSRWRVVVTKRAAFPANEWVDPAVVIRAELRNLGSDDVMASARVILAEDSDFSLPTVQWHPGEVWVTGFDSRKNQTVTLRHRPNVR